MLDLPNLREVCVLRSPAFVLEADNEAAFEEALKEALKEEEKKAFNASDSSDKRAAFVFLRNLRGCDSTAHDDAQFAGFVADG